MEQSPLLLIDDCTENLHVLRRMLEWTGYSNIQCCGSGRAGLDVLSTFKPDLVILDLMMPNMNGYEFLKRVRELTPDAAATPILVFTADMSAEAKTRALALGAADFLTKPGDAIEIQLRVRNFLRMRKMQRELEGQNHLLEELIQQRTEHLTIARREAVEVLASVCEYRDDETGQHARRVGELSAALATELGLDCDFIDSIRLAAPLHDLGKIAIRDSILFKPDTLTSDEYTEMKKHSGIGAALLGEKTSPLLKLAREIALYHHERWDGDGYEAGLAGEDIPLAARIVAVADSYDAMTNDRLYRKRRSSDDALEELRTLSGTQFDPSVVAAMERLMDSQAGALLRAA